MVNNSTNIHKTNIHLYILTHWIQKGKHMTLEIHVLAWEHAHKYGWAELVNGIPTFPSW